MLSFTRTRYLLLAFFFLISSDTQQLAFVFVTHLRIYYMT